MSLTVSAKDWDAYIRRLAALDETAAEKMRDFVKKNGFGDMNALIDYAYALATKYGEGAATLAAAMYDAVAELSGKLFDPAVPAETASYDQVAKTVQGVAKVSRNPEEMGSAVGRLVKQAGADTTMRNALRDGAEFAWVPSGDTCAFCITLASRGWQRASQKAVKGGHAEHIHSNCDCTYAIRFDSKGGVAGYDPEKYLRMYEGAEGDTPREKINSLRRADYAEHKDEINAQKRAAYAGRVKKKELLASGDGGTIDVQNPVKRITAISASTITEKVNSGEYSLQLSDQNYNKHVMGHRDYERYKESREKKGLLPQSILTVSKEEAQRIIRQKSGTGIVKVRKDGTPMNIEEISCEGVIGEYWSHGAYHKTNKAAIHYGNRGAHLVPQYGGHYD